MMKFWSGEATCHSFESSSTISADGGQRNADEILECRSNELLVQGDLTISADGCSRNAGAIMR